jgi:hypothetical protein
VAIRDEDAQIQSEKKNEKTNSSINRERFAKNCQPLTNAENLENKRILAVSEEEQAGEISEQHMQGKVQKLYKN